MKTAKIKLNDTEYTLCFSLRVARNCTEHFGGLKEMQEEMRSENTTKMLDTVVWVLAEMLDAGARYDRKCGNNAPEPLTMDDLYDTVDIGELANLKGKIYETLTNGQTADIKVQPEKNEETNPAN